jgi:hypothetical protein
MQTIIRTALALAVMFTAVAMNPAAQMRPKQILLIADKPSHGPGQHEHNAAVWQFQKWLKNVPGVAVTASYDGWPADPSAVDKADAIYMFCTGGKGHEAFGEPDRIAALKKAAARGAGLMFYHYCVEPPADSGHAEMLDWMGGYFEINYSVNPVWDADFKELPNHPITRGVKPFHQRDEWYFNMRFVDKMRGVTPILTAIPTPDTLSRPDGPHQGNPDVRAKAGQPQIMMWAYERPGGGRGVGFTGGHYHTNLGDPNVRKLVLNSLLWIARVDVPPNGVDVTVTPEELNERLDPKVRRGGN